MEDFIIFSNTYDEHNKQLLQTVLKTVDEKTMSDSTRKKTIFTAPAGKFAGCKENGF
jgi:hypothetical protein